MAEKPRFDLVVLGYRNDLARERVIEAVSRSPASAACCAPLTRSTPLPHVLYRGLDSRTGMIVAAELREEGAIVRLVGDEDLDPQQPTSTAGTQSKRRLPMLVALLILTFVAAALHFGARKLGIDPATRFHLRRLNDEAVMLSEAGEHAEAERRLRDALQQSPEEQALRRNLQAVLANWAIAELDAGHPAEAVRLAERAFDLGEEVHVMSILGLAYAANRDGAGAVWALERALELGAKQPDTFIALGNIYRERGDSERAVAMFQTAREHGATGEHFLDMLQRLERELDTEWDFTEWASPHFSVAFEEGENLQAARLVLESLEEAYESIGSRFGYYPSERIPVVLYAKEEFHDVTQTPEWTGGVFDGRIKLPVQGLDDRTPLLDRALRHEYTHVVVADLTRGSPSCPTWLKEGLAMWAEDRPEEEATSWALAVLDTQPPVRFEGISCSFLQLSHDRAGAAYAQSYLAVRELAYRYGELEIRSLLHELGEGAPFEEAFRSAFDYEFSHFEREFLGELGG